MERTTRPEARVPQPTAAALIPVRAGSRSGIFLVACGLAMSAVVLTQFHVHLLAAILGAAVLGSLVLPRLLPWRAQISCIALVILFIPIRRYVLPGALPIDLEPYRLVVAIVVLAWLSSALIDPRVRLRTTGLIDVPLLMFLVCIGVSLLSNPHRVASVSGVVVKGVLFFASFVAVTYMLPSLVRSRRDVEFLIDVMLLGGAVVAALALVEARTGFNVFHHLDRVIPFLRAVAAPEETLRGGRLRVFASAQHPIALGAMLVMLTTLALSRVLETRQRRWWIVLFMLAAGAFATNSRTTIIMFAVAGIVYGVIRPKDVRRLIVPVIVVGALGVHTLLPGTLGTVRESFFPKGGLVQQQRDAPVGSGRLATLGPVLRKEFYPNILFGEGFSTRVTGRDTSSSAATNAPILDDEWAGVLTETGIAGALSLLAFFALFVARASREARRDPSSRGLLLTSFAASVAAYAVSMFTYDAFSFIQVTFVLYIFIGMASAVYSWPRPVVQQSSPASGLEGTNR